MRAKEWAGKAVFQVVSKRDAQLCEPERHKRVTCDRDNEYLKSARDKVDEPEENG